MSGYEHYAAGARVRQNLGSSGGVAPSADAVETRLAELKGLQPPEKLKRYGFVQHYSAVVNALADCENLVMLFFSIYERVSICELLSVSCTTGADLSAKRKLRR